MPAYVVVRIDVHDPEVFQRYVQAAPASISHHGGRYLTRGGAVEALEGEWSGSRFAILEFPDLVTARTWYESREYAAARALREACATTQMLLAEGLPESWIPGWPGEGSAS
ncbi:MAG: DUF1330 domain-containing protein [Candidatus Eisenbacteria bacterium]|nr:DUF1330 domain-containing protein [Candidatus Eisenbacteria bacterium]